MNYRVKNWDEYQHYKHRNPSWIKLHVSILSSEEWVMASDRERVLAIACMLVASKKDGIVPNKPEYIKRVAYLSFNPDLDALVRAGFLVKEYTEEETQADASTMQADASTMQADASTKCKHSSTNARPEKRREEKSREDKIREDNMSDFQPVIDYLNEIASKRYKLTSEIKKLMLKIAKEGYSIEDMKRACYLQVLGCKGKPEVEQYMHPSTIFRNTKNFDRCLNLDEKALKKANLPKTNKYIEENKENYY